MAEALVVGINRYNADQIRDLQFAVDDAHEVSDTFAAAGFNVVKLTDQNASREKIYWELEVGLNQRTVDEDDPVVIYWAGHGMTDSRPVMGRKSGTTAFLLPSDTRIDQPLATALTVPSVWELLDKLRTRRLLAILDTCFSGAFAEGGRGFSLGDRGGAAAVAGDLLKLGGHGRVVICACSGQEVACEDEATGHGLFTNALISVLGQGVGDSKESAPISQLMNAVRDATELATKRQQTPYLYQSAQGSDWSLPLPPSTPYRAPMPGWAFVGTSGGVGKTTLAMVTAELLAEAGNTVMYLDADIAHLGGTSEWCQRAKLDIGRVRTFADHVSEFSRSKLRVTSRELSSSLLDVTPEYLRRHDCGKVLLLPGARASDKLFVFDLVAEIKDRRSNSVCREILSAAFDRGRRMGADCVIVDCGAQFDPLAVNALAAAHHPFIVAAARAGAKDQRDTIVSNCLQVVDNFDRMRVQTVVNRVPSTEALVNHWGTPGYGRPGMGFQYLPFDPELFKDWEEGRPNFELGYDGLSSAWHTILVESDHTACDGLHRSLLPSEWDRFSKWALWIADHPGWVESERTRLRRSLRLAAVAGTTLAAAIVAIALYLGLASDQSTALILLAWIGLGVAAISLLISTLLVRGGIQRRRVLSDVNKHSGTKDDLRNWFTVPVNDSPWWKFWRPSRRAAIEWLHRRVDMSRSADRRFVTSGSPE
ncbi:MAG: caspase family protein [Actinomycetota bacterium]|nr:caspase family protein [Actinomycetota bacterium]